MKNIKNKMEKNRIKSCRVCGNKKLVPCIDIGEQYLSSIFPENINYKKELEKTEVWKAGIKDCSVLYKRCNMSFYV